MLKVGDRAPEFSGLDHRGSSLVLSDLLRKGPVVLYFYPKAFTPGCTIETCKFRDIFEEFSELGAQVLGVSVDKVGTQRRFAERYGVPFSLVADRDKVISSAYGVLGFFDLFAKRVTYVIDRSGVIRGVFHHELSMQRHIDDVHALLTHGL